MKGAAAGAAGMVAGMGHARIPESRPNVLFIIVDQMRRPMWTPEDITPNFDRLAASGVSFTSAYCSAVMCSPSRACIMTGTQTTQNRMFLNCDRYTRGTQPDLDPKIPTLGQIFARAGYRTLYRGKWHLTHEQGRTDGIDNYGFEGWTWLDGLTGRRTDCGEINGGGPRCGEENDPIFARQAADWLHGQAGRTEPWLLVCSLVNPHDICQYPGNYPAFRKLPVEIDSPPPNWNDDLSTKPKAHARWQFYCDLIYGRVKRTSELAWRKYLDFYVWCLRDMDRNLGTVLDALDASGHRENTLVVFTSDHGEMGGSHGLRYKGYFAYEEEINVPLVFSWPGRIGAGLTTRALASGVDLLPTLTSLAGIHNPGYTAGVDLTPALKDPAGAAVRDHVIFHEDVNYLGGLEIIPTNIRAIRDSEWKYVYYFNPARADIVDYEIYNLKDDPLEMVNLARDPARGSKRGEMHDRMMEQERKFEKEFEFQERKNG